MIPPAAERKSGVAPISVRPLDESDLDRADEICRMAFGTFLGVREPFGTVDYVHTRWAADPRSAFAATVGGEIVGSNFATNWGSIGYFGPLTVHPDLWDQGIGRRLMEPVMDCFDAWGTPTSVCSPSPTAPSILSSTAGTVSGLDSSRPS